MKKSTLLLILFFCLAVAIIVTLMYLFPQYTCCRLEPSQVRPEKEVPLTSERGETVFLDGLSTNGKISSPLTIHGRARGTWFFEASFPVMLVDWDGRIIAHVPAQAEGEWMTTDYVPFAATLEFDKPSYKDTGALILKKDNPSGLPEHDDAVEVPIVFE